MFSAQVLDESEQLPRTVVVVVALVLSQLLKPPGQLPIFFFHSVGSLLQDGDVGHRSNLVIQEQQVKFW